jgi:hypothetical protein
MPHPAVAAPVTITVEAHDNVTNATRAATNRPCRAMVIF